MTDRIAHLYRTWRYRPRPIPRLKAEAGLLVPGWFVRLLATLCLDAMLMVSGWNCDVPLLPLAAMMGGLALWLMIRPMYQASVLAIIAAAIFLLLAPVTGLVTISLPTMVCGYLGWRLTMVASLLPWSGAAQPRALLGFRDVVIVAVSTLVAGAGLLASVGGAWTVMVGAAGVVLVALAVAVPGRRDP